MYREKKNKKKSMICYTRLRQCHNRKKKKKKRTHEPLRSQEGFEKVIPGAES